MAKGTMKILRITILMFAVPLFAAEVLDNAAVIRLVGTGLAPDVIVLKIEGTEAAFDTTTDGLVALKKASVPDSVIRAMLLKKAVTLPAPQVSTAVVAPRPPSLATPPVPSAPGGDVCANVQFYTTGNDGPAWVPSSVCVGDGGVSVDDQTIPFSDLAFQCAVKAPILVFGGSQLRGQEEWWLGDAKETMKFRGRPEDFEHIVTALMRARRDIPHGGCNAREMRRLLVRP
jgi:hypothetical protein